MEMLHQIWIHGKTGRSRQPGLAEPRVLSPGPECQPFNGRDGGRAPDGTGRRQERHGGRARRACPGAWGRRPAGLSAARAAAAAPASAAASARPGSAGVRASPTARAAEEPSRQERWPPGNPAPLPGQAAGYTVSAASATINTRPVRRGISQHQKRDACHAGAPIQAYFQDMAVAAAMFFSPDCT